MQFLQKGPIFLS